MVAVRTMTPGLVGVLGLCGCAVFGDHTPVSGYVADSAITARVRAALVQDPTVEASEVSVQTYNGQVTLNGVVDDQAMVRRAVLLTEQTPGVKSVRNAMQVPPTAVEVTAR